MMEPEELLATLAILFAHKGATREVATLTFAESIFDEAVSYDFHHEPYPDGINFIIKVPIEVYAQISDFKEEIQRSILQEARSLSDFNKILKEVFVDPIPPKGS